MKSATIKEFLYYYIIDEAPVLVMIIDNKGVVLKSNKYSEDLFGYSAVDHNITDLFVTFGKNIDLDEMIKTPEKIHRLNINTYTNLPETLYIHFYPVDENILIVGNVNMLEMEKLRKQLVNTSSELNAVNRELQKKNAQLEHAKKQLEQMARTDPLTTLSNRRDFYDIIVKEAIRFERNLKPFSIVMSDIDNFKIYNDTYGHECGDFILVSIANIFRTELRKQDSVGRWGGEEFILLLPNTNAQGAYNVTEKLRKKIDETILHYSDLELHVTLTFGVREFEKDMSIKTCIHHADIALYRGKNNGKNNVTVYNDTMEEQ